mgnify:CR=1 FL=1
MRLISLRVWKWCRKAHHGVAPRSCSVSFFIVLIFKKDSRLPSRVLFDLTSLCLFNNEKSFESCRKQSSLLPTGHSLRSCARYRIRTLQVQYPDWIFYFTKLIKNAQSGFESCTHVPRTCYRALICASLKLVRGTGFEPMTPITSRLCSTN